MFRSGDHILQKETALQKLINHYFLNIEHEKCEQFIKLAKAGDHALLDPNMEELQGLLDALIPKADTKIEQNYFQLPQDCEINDFPENITMKDVLDALEKYTKRNENQNAETHSFKTYDLDEVLDDMYSKKETHNQNLTGYFLKEDFDNLQNIKFSQRNTPKQQYLAGLAEKLFNNHTLPQYLHFRFSTFGKNIYHPDNLPEEWYSLHLTLKLSEEDMFYSPYSDEREQCSALEITIAEAYDFFKKWKHPLERNPKETEDAELQQVLLLSKQEFEAQNQTNYFCNYDDDEPGGAPPPDAMNQQPTAEQLKEMGLTAEDFANLQL